MPTCPPTRRVRNAAGLLLTTLCFTAGPTGCAEPDCGYYSDLDCDGFEAPDDCDDDNPSVHPDVVEQCDGLDENCDGEIDDGCPLVLEADWRLETPLDDPCVADGDDRPIDSFGTTVGDPAFRVTLRYPEYGSVSLWGSLDGDTFSAATEDAGLCRRQWTAHGTFLGPWDVDGTLEVSFEGSCDGCQASTFSLRARR